MFDLTSTKLLLLAIVALVFVPPKDLPGLMRTLGRYAGMLRRQAAEFRTQIEDALRESELAEIKQDVDRMARQTEDAVRGAGQSVHEEVANAKREADAALAPAHGVPIPSGVAPSAPVPARPSMPLAEAMTADASALASEAPKEA